MDQNWPEKWLEAPNADGKASIATAHSASPEVQESAASLLSQGVEEAAGIDKPAPIKPTLYCRFCNKELHPAFDFCLYCTKSTS